MDDAIIEAQTDKYARLCLEYNATFKRLVNQAREPGFTIDSWAPLSALAAVDDFVRVGSFKEVVGWKEYIGLLQMWAPTLTNWESTFKRVTAADRRVFLELEERSTSGGKTTVVNSLTVWEYDANDKLRHLDIYLQMEPQEQSTNGWEIEKA